jgi:hypothetical protein
VAEEEDVAAEDVARKRPPCVVLPVMAHSSRWLTR